MPTKAPKSGNVTKTATGVDSKVNLTGTAKEGDFVMIDGMKYTFASGADGSDGATFSDKASLIAAAAKNGITINADNTVKKGGTALTLQIGDTGDDFNQLKVNIDGLLTPRPWASPILTSPPRPAPRRPWTRSRPPSTMSPMSAAPWAPPRTAWTTPSTTCPSCTENIQDAESTIRDTDVADEMMAYTKNNILIQSAQAMLAQANQVPQGVLQLLQ